MTIAELGAIGELVGGVAVIASLLFVGMQIRQGNATDQLSANLGLQSSHNETVGLLIADTGLLLEGLGGFNQLPEPERLRVAGILYTLYAHAELVFQQRQHGLIASDTADRHFGWLFWVHSWPGPREWWNVGPILRGQNLAANRDIFSADFVRFVDETNPFTPIPEEAAQ